MRHTLLSFTRDRFNYIAIDEECFHSICGRFSIHLLDACIYLRVGHQVGTAFVSVVLESKKTYRIGDTIAIWLQGCKLSFSDRQN